MLNLEQRYEWFKHTINECSSSIYKKNNEDFEYIIFEELPINIYSFLHKETLDVLINEWYIDEKIYNLSLELRRMYLEKEQFIENLCEIDKVRTSDVLNKLTKLADEILEMLYM